MLRFFNTLTKKKEIFKPLKDKKVGLYDCGLTVYNFAHIGNLRRYIFSDVLRRYLEYLGYKVIQVRNITDVGHLTQDDIDRGEDKILKAARKEKKSPLQIARFYEKAFWEDTKKLKLLKPHKNPRATEHIEDMIKAIQELITKGYAYEASDGVYFNVFKFRKYGQLSGNTPKELVEKKFGRKDVKKGDKKSPLDFALWLKAGPKHLLKWDSPWGVGYPGWHIECSVMSQKYLGPQIDIHTGGEDNIFPHHENEIAQSEALTGKRFVKYWLHSRYLQIEGRKMAKREGGFLRLKDLEKEGYSPRDFRMLCLQSHYRSRLDFSFKALSQAHKNLKKIEEFLERLEHVRQKGGLALTREIKKIKNRFQVAMDDDLNTPKALAYIFRFINQINVRLDPAPLAGARVRGKSRGEVSQKDARAILETFKEFDKVFAIFEKEKKEIPAEIMALVQEREKARKKRDFKKADQLRKKILKLGFQIKDTRKGSEISRK